MVGTRLLECPYEYVAVGCEYIETPESRSTILQPRTLIDKSYSIYQKDEV
ncbi:MULTISPECIES: hypothetical protein [unclassified Microcoleus]|nr:MULTISPECIES: hypothetical protein [unclassified Microcoleus]